MVSTKAKHPNCMYKWMNWITSPKVNAQVAEYFGEAPAQTLACKETTDPNFCATYHATDADYAKKIAYWTTPQKHCVDGNGTDCTDVHRLGERVAADQGLAARAGRPIAVRRSGLHVLAQGTAGAACSASRCSGSW